MKKVIILVFLCLVAALYCLGQTTQNPLSVNITAQSTDCSVANSCAWQLLTLNAGTSVVTLSGTFSGTFIVEQTNNGTTWTSAGTVTSAGTTSYSSNGFTAIRVRCSAYTSGTAAVTLSTGTGGGSGSGLPSGGSVGQTVVNTASGTGTWQNIPIPSTTGGVGYSVVASPTCPVTSSTLAAGNTCQFVYDDGYVVATDVTTNGTTTITCPNNDCNFTTITQPQFGSTIVGMIAWAFRTGHVELVVDCTPATITAVTANTITMAGTTCASGGAAASSIVIGHRDANNLAKAWTTAGCGTLGLPSLSANPIAKAGSQAIMLVDIGIFNIQPTSCSASGSGGVYGGPSLYGTPASTTLMLTPDFVFNNTFCPGVASAGITGSYNVCFGPGPIIWYGVDIVGAGFNTGACGTNALVMQSAGAGGATQFSNIDNICIGNANLIGALLYSADYRFLGGGVQNVGGIAMRAPASNGFPVYLNTSLLVEDNANSANTDIGLQVDAGAVVVDHGSNITNSLVNGTFIGEGTMHMTFNGATGQNATQLNTSGAIMDCTGCTFNSTQASFGSPGNTSVGLYLHGSGTKAVLKSTTFWQGAPSGGFGLFTVAGSTFTDAGGNVFPSANGGTATSVSGSVVGSLSMAQTPIVVGNLVPSANFGSGAAVSAVTGNATNFTFTLTNGTASVGASPTIAFTFPATFWVTPSRCSLWQVGGTQAILATTEFLAPSAQSATGVTFTYNGTPTINLTEFYQGSCSN